MLHHSSTPTRSAVQLKENLAPPSPQLIDSLVLAEIAQPRYALSLVSRSSWMLSTCHPTWTLHKGQQPWQTIGEKLTPPSFFFLKRTSELGVGC